jgi:hypothetical protein
VNPIEILVKARKLIDSPEKWAKREQIRYPFRICAYLALARAARGAYYGEAYGCLQRAAGLGPEELIHHWNDAPERTHADVMAAFDRAIATERAKEAANG